MRADYLRFVSVTSIVLLITWTISCSGRNGKTAEKTGSPGVQVETARQSGSLRMDHPASDAEFNLKDKIPVALTPLPVNITLDSVKIYFDGREQGTVRSAPWEFSIPQAENRLTGRRSVKAVAYSGGNIMTATRFVVVYSDVAPVKYGYRVVRTYPHDKDAFTQGLFYDRGFLYEGTGQEAGSSLREVELATGRVIKQTSLDPSLFGEGITLYKGRIYQVTWKNKVGFVYDEETFNLINKIYYQTQGWGLTTIDDRIVMSDGTNVIYYFDPETFTVISQIEVYDNKRKVDQLNELEYINGEIWANIWMTDQIARIDPVTGKVNSYVDLSGIFPERERVSTDADVLNGIAYDQAGKRIFVTGKKWPKLYEIVVTE
jgi:glutamine cyclotransferase